MDNIHIFLQYKMFVESNNTQDAVTTWRKQLQKIVAKPDETMQGFNSIKNLVDQFNTVAYNKLHRFHFLEYKLRVLQTIYPSKKQLIDFTEYELKELFHWIKQWMLGILDTRVYYNADNDKRTLEMFSTNLSNFKPGVRQRIIGTREPGLSWDSIVEGYYRLTNAETLKDKILAVTLTLNAWHDNGAIFGPTAEYPDDYWVFAPLSLEQLDSLNYINQKAVELEIQKEL